MLLFIPMLNDCKNYNERKQVSLLRRSVNFSVSQVSDILNNKLFEEFSKLDKFIYERGLPQIQLQTSEHININKESNIRICLTKFNDTDFLAKKILQQRWSTIIIFRTLSNCKSKKILKR